MSDSSLSLPPASELGLPAMLQTPFVLPLGMHPPLRLRRNARPHLPKSDSILFTASLYSRTLLETTPTTVQFRCLQPQCIYTPKPQLLDYSITSNYWTHLKHSHPKVFALYKDSASDQGSQSSSYTSNVVALFTPRLSKSFTPTTEAFQTKYWALLLDFIVSNNLALRIADSLAYRRLIQHCNTSIITISTSTLNRDLNKTFLLAQNTLKEELHKHV
jgi:hypothetical protein